MSLVHNDLRADEGRETEALNCKPNTNLKEISELSNYYKPAAFVCTLLADVALTRYLNPFIYQFHIEVNFRFQCSKNFQ
jgi:hypothetical protein